MLFNSAVIICSQKTETENCLFSFLFTHRILNFSSKQYCLISFLIHFLIYFLLLLFYYYYCSFLTGKYFHSGQERTIIIHVIGTVYFITETAGHKVKNESSFAFNTINLPFSFFEFGHFTSLRSVTGRGYLLRTIILCLLWTRIC